MHTETTPASLVSVGLLPIDIGRSYGLTLYLPVPLENYLLTHPELAIYRDVNSAVAKLSTSLRSPLGTSRVFHPSPFLSSNGRYSIANEFRTHIERLYNTDSNSVHGVTLHSNPGGKYRCVHTYKYSYTHNYSYGGEPTSAEEYLRNWVPSLYDCIAVLEEPIITDPSSFDPSTFKSFPRLACLSHSIHERIVNDSIYIEDGRTPGLFGLPTVVPVRYTKSGAPRRKPGLTIAAKREAELALRGSLVLPAMRTFVQQFNAILFPPQHQSDYRRGGYWHYIFNQISCLSCLDDRRNRRAIQTVDDDAHSFHKAMLDLRDKLRLINDWSHNNEKESLYCGFLRTPSIYLRTFHRESVLSALSVMQPHLSTLRNYPRYGIKKKISSTDDNYRANVALSLHHELYRLARAMYPGRCDRFMFPSPAAPAAQESL